MVYNGYYKVMSNIPKMGQLPTPVQHLVRLHPSGIVNEDTQLSRKVEPVFSVFCNNSTWFTWLHFRWNNTPYIQEILQNPQMLQSNGMCNHMSSGVVLNWVDLFIDPSWMLFILSNWVVIHYPALLTSIVCREMKVHIITNYICESNYSISIYMLVHGNIQHGNRAPGKSRGLVFFFVPDCEIPYSLETYWIHLDSSFHSQNVSKDAIFAGAKKQNVPSNNDLVAGICYAHRQHRLYLAPYIKASWSRPWVSQSLPWIRAAKGLRTLIHRWQCYSFWTVCWHCSSKKVPAIPRHPWCRLKRIDMLQLFQWQRPLFFTLM